MAERDHGELGASREFLCLHFDRTVELLAKTGVEAEQLKEEELRDQVRCRSLDGARLARRADFFGAASETCSAAGMTGYSLNCLTARMRKSD